MNYKIKVIHSDYQSFPQFQSMVSQLRVKQIGKEVNIWA